MLVNACHLDGEYSDGKRLRMSFENKDHLEDYYSQGLARY